MFNPLKTAIRNEFDLSPVPRLARHLYHDARVVARGLRNAVGGSSVASLADAWWYYSVELSPGVVTKGAYAKDFPFGPRIVARRCDLAGMDCLELGAMEGVMPVLMARQGARKVLAADASFHCYMKMDLLKKQYGVSFDFEQIGLMYDLSDKLKHRGGFDLIMLAGVLYHVFSPMHVIASVRPLLKKNGILILSTNVVNRPDMVMDFNDRGRLQTEVNTFWYLSVPLFDYMLRYFKLLPIDCVYVPHEQTRLRVDGVNSGLLTVACRATEDDAVDASDTWGRTSQTSWEYGNLCDMALASQQETSSIRYRDELDRTVAAPDGRSIDLHRAVKERAPILRAERPEDSYLLRLSDRS